MWMIFLSLDDMKRTAIRLLQLRWVIALCSCLPLYNEFARQSNDKSTREGSRGDPGAADYDVHGDPRDDGQPDIGADELVK